LVSKQWAQVKERDNYSILGSFTAISFGQVSKKAVDKRKNYIVECKQL